jgi:hypothetical protein
MRIAVMSNGTIHLNKRICREHAEVIAVLLANGQSLWVLDDMGKFSVHLRADAPANCFVNRANSDIMERAYLRLERLDLTDVRPPRWMRSLQIHLADVMGERYLDRITNTRMEIPNGRGTR